MLKWNVICLIQFTLFGIIKSHRSFTIYFNEKLFLKNKSIFYILNLTIWTIDISFLRGLNNKYLLVLTMMPLLIVKILEKCLLDGKNKL